MHLPTWQQQALPAAAELLLVSQNVLNSTSSAKLLTSWPFVVLFLFENNVSVTKSKFRAVV
jgi:hypothetical protein